MAKVITPMAWMVLQGELLLGNERWCLSTLILGLVARSAITTLPFMGLDTFLASIIVTSFAGRCTEGTTVIAGIVARIVTSCACTAVILVVVDASHAVRLIITSTSLSALGHTLLAVILTWIWALASLSSLASWILREAKASE